MVGNKTAKTGYEESGRGVKDRKQGGKIDLW